LNYLLDTCVVSELIKPKNDKNVLSWFKGKNEECIFISVLTFGELFKGITKLPDSKKKELLHDWVENDLKQRFSGRVLEITEEIAIRWGKIAGDCEKKGLQVPVIDGLIAATAIEEDLTVVTRNIKDIEFTGCKYVDPWE